MVGIPIGFGFKFYGVVLGSSSCFEIHVFSRLYQPYVSLYLLTFSSLDAFSKDIESDSDLRWKKQSAHLNQVQGSSVGRRARGKAFNFI